MPNVLHSHATGIHPGAYVQPRAPDPAPFQDGTLWVDTSSGPPFALYTWTAYLARWQLVGQTQSADTSCCGTAIPTQDKPQTGSGVTNTASRCGAASAMADYLERYYSNVRVALLFGLTTGITWALSGVLDLLVTTATGGLDVPWIGIVQAAALKVAQIVVGYSLAGTLADAFPTLDSTDNATILQGIYVSLPTTDDPITVTADSLSAWEAFITKATMPCGPVSQQILSLLIGIVSLGSWQQIAYFGAYQPSGACAGWSLLGTALQGGATLGVSIEQSLQGGATLGVSIEQSLQGGATL